MATDTPTTLGDFTAKVLEEGASEREISLAPFSSGAVTLVVNVASAHYVELQELYATYQSSGFHVLAFPCNQFGGQESGTDADVLEFARSRGATFPVFSKVEVNGDGAHPLFKWLREFNGGEDITWNFHKFLVVDGKVTASYGPREMPSGKLDGEVEAAVAALSASDAPRSEL